MRSWRPSTLRARLAAWYAAVLALTLVVFAGIVYLIVAEDEANEPPAVAALEPPEQVVPHMLIAVAVALPGAIAIAVGGGLWITRRSLRPLEQIARVADDLGADRLDRRVEVPEGTATELARVADALNHMLARLDRSVEGMRRFTENASHELRTPLAAMRAELEVTLRRSRSVAELHATCESTLEEVTRLSALVEALLTLARSDAGELPLKRTAIDLVEIVRRVVSSYEAVALDRGLALESSTAGTVAAVGDPLWVERAVANIVDNACKLTPRGGRVRILADRADGWARIVVSDTGPGLPDDAERVFERFWRSNRDRTTDGFGLGLALTRDVVRALGGSVRATASDGGGATFTIELPAS